MVSVKSGKIGVFDSGVGGLTVLTALRQAFPGEDFLYLADTARLPYGSKSLETIAKYNEQCASFLKRFDVKMIVVACNSASTALLEHPLKMDIPIFNVIEPGARKALEVSESKRIGVVGTRATVGGGAYVRVIQGMDSSAQVFQQACPLWVPLVEEGWVEDPVTSLIVYRYLGQIARHQVDTLVMGCTHFPVLKKTIQNTVGPSVRLVDSSSGLIEDLSKYALKDSGSGEVEILCTDYSPRLEETMRMLLGDLHIDSLQATNI